MVNAYLAGPDAVAVDAWAPIGMFGTFDAPPKEPVLDIVAERDFDEVPLRRKRAGDSPPTKVLAADDDRGHRSLLRQSAEELAAAIAMFLERAFGGAAVRAKLQPIVVFAARGALKPVADREPFSARRHGLDEDRVGVAPSSARRLA